jgi:hypothetical protein
MGNHVLRAQNGEIDPYQALSQGVSIEELFNSKGIDPALYRDERDLVLFRSARIASLDRHPGGALDEDFNTSPAVDALYAGAQARGELFVHEPYTCRITDFDKTNLWKETYTWLVAQPVPAGRWNLERYAHALASLDPGAMFGGGWMVPLGEELTSREWFQTFLALPNRPFQEVAAGSQPVTIRRSAQDDATVVYLVNDFPWKAHVQLELTCRGDTPTVRLGPGAPIALGPNADGGSRLVFELKPFDLQAAELASADVQVLKAHVVLDDAGREELDRKFQKLNESLLTRKNQVESVFPDKAIPTDFESGTTPGELPGEWRVIAGVDGEGDDPASAQVDSEVAHEGRRSLRLRAASRGATLVGPAFPRPEGRVLGALVWMRSSEKPISAQIAFEGTYDGKQYLRSSTVRVEPEWKPFLLRVFDLPDAGIESLRVRFDLLASGTVWIDDFVVKLDPLTEDELRELTKTVSSLHSARIESRWADFRRLLDSYWARFVVAHWRPLSQEGRRDVAESKSRRTDVFRK